MAETVEKKDSLIRAGLPAALYGMALGTLFFAVGSVYSTVSPTVPVVVFTAMGFLFGSAVKLAESF